MAVYRGCAGGPFEFVLSVILPIHAFVLSVYLSMNLLPFHLSTLCSVILPVCAYILHVILHFVLYVVLPHCAFGLSFASLYICFSCCLPC